MDRAELRDIIRRSGCTVTREGRDGFPTEFDCEDPWSKVRMLDALAWRDARYDPRIRRIALAICSRAPSTAPPMLAAALHGAVKGRVRYLGEGIDTFQSSWQTWNWRHGDCDDTSRLIVALARSVGLPARIVALPRAAGDPAHAVAIVAGRWCDASIDAATGEHPIAAKQRLKRAGRPVYNYTGRPTSPGAIGDIGDVTDDARRTARAAIIEAWALDPSLPAPSPAAYQMVQAIALGPEGSDGSGCWTNRGSAPPCPGVCHNWAGLQLPGSPTTHDGSIPDCPPGSAPCTDHLADGSEFGVCFKTYASQAEGAADYLHRLMVVYGAGPVIGSGNADLVARTMYEGHYFTGTSGTAADRISRYAGAIAAAADRIASSLGEPLLVQRGDLYGGGAGSHAVGMPTHKLLALGALVTLGVYGYRRGWHARFSRAVKSAFG